jgi:hypothetical protein
MEIDTQKVDEAVLGLLYLTLHDGRRAWKGMDWDTLERLFRNGLIENPASKAKSAVLTDQGLREAEGAFERLFSKRPDPSWENLPNYKNTKICPAGGTTGFICRNAIDGKPFFRVYEADGIFIDYRLGHDDLEVTITHETQASFYRSENVDLLDHSPEVLGLNERE